MSEHAAIVPIELFIQALTGQLDRAQQAMATKAQLRNLPLTFAVKDITLDLKAYVRVIDSVVQVQPAGPGDSDASTLHIAFTTITKPMIEENVIQFAAQPDEPSIKEVLGDTMNEEEQRRLEWIGVQTVSQLRELKRRAGEQTIQKLANVPAERLQAALARAATPYIQRVERSDSAASGNAALLRIRGANLRGGGAHPKVFVGGEPLSVIEARDDAIVVAPDARQLHLAGTLEVEIEPGNRAGFELSRRTLAATLGMGADAAQGDAA